MNRNKDNFNILLVEPDELFQKATYKILTDGGYNVDTYNNIKDAKDKIKSKEYDLYIIAIEIGDDKEGGFELLSLIRRSKIKPDIILTTEKNLNEYLDEILARDINIILAKPIKRFELLTLCEKLLYKTNIFGIENYLSEIQDIYTMKIRSSQEIRPVIKKIVELSKKWGFNFEYAFKIDLVAHEIVINALYHSHGFTEEKLKGLPISLKDNYVEINVAHDKTRFGFSVIDFMGNLTRERILSSIYDVVKQQQKLKEMEANGKTTKLTLKPHGRGIDIVRKYSGEYYFNIKRGEKTEVVVIFDSEYDRDDEFTSIKIFEVI